MESSEGRKRKNEIDIPCSKKKKKTKGQETEEPIYSCGDEARKCVSDTLKKLEAVSDREGFTFFKDIKEKLLVLKNKNLTDKMYIGVFGKSGVGKSFLINALLDEEFLLPSGSGEACTSVLIEVQADTNATNYNAGIEFISKSEWESDLRFMKDMIADEATEDGDELEDMAREKIEAVYGSKGINQSYNELLKSQTPQPFPTTLKIFKDNASDLSKAIGCYIRNDGSFPQKYWPLVKKVTISLPASSKYLDRIVLIDLPGSGDINKERDEMWKTCLSKCASVWIVNDITRALNGKESIHILRNTFRIIAGGGECCNIAYICTQTDRIDPEEFKRQFNITNADLGLAPSEQSDKQKEKEAAIGFRNQKYKEKIQELLDKEAKKCLLGDEEESENVFNVYTVSSQEYMNIRKGRTAIMKENDTELPLLHEHIRNMVIQHSQKAEKDYITEVFGVLSCLTFSKDNEKLVQVAEFNSELSVLLKNELDKVCENLVTFLNDVSENLESCLKDGVVEAEKMCIKSAMDEVIKPKMKNFRGYHRTLKAVCRSNGSYSSSKGPIDLNYTLSRPMYTSVNKTFLQTFRNSRSSINIIFDNVLYDFISSERLNKYKSSKVYPQVVFVKTELKRILSELEKEIRYIKKSINNSLSDSIKKIMQPAYEEASKISGTHAFKKIQKTLEDRIVSSQNTMFQRAKEEMLHRFDDLKKLVNNRIKEKMKESITLALNQSEVDETFPDIRDEFKTIKKCCKDLQITMCE
nr:PREDICTED: nuclear GTPase SLIP-GC-like [Lepisosteus oculatus]